MELSEPQRLAVETVGRNLCVSAGAGSGKTRVLVERFVHLVKEKGISPAGILAITFTEKAANEMKRRIVERLREEGLERARREVENAAIGTIHSFAARVLREHPFEAGVDPHFSILESDEAETIQEKVLDQTLEGLVEDPASGVFNLLRIYGEESIRQGVFAVYRASRNSEVPFEELLKRRTPAEPAVFEKKIRQGIEEIDSPDAPEKTRVILSEAKDLLKDSSASGLRMRVLLSALKSSLRAAGKQKEAIACLKETLEDYIAFLIEEESLPVRESFVRIALRFERAYETLKREARALDFDDLQIRAVRLLAAKGPVSQSLGRIYREKYREILVDEFQDTNPLQDRLLDLVRSEANLFIVGDFKQSIYGFRGTRVEIFLEKEKEFRKNALGLGLSLVENHRAVPRLIEFINRFFGRLWEEDGLPFEPLAARRPESASQKVACPGRPEEKSGPCVEWLELEKKKEEDLAEVRIREARTLARRIVSLVEEEGFHYKDIACLFDAMGPSPLYEQEFRRAGIPYYVVSSRDFYGQPEVRDVLSFLSALENPKQDVPLAAALRSPLFQISDDTLFWLAHRAKMKTKETPLLEGVRIFETIPGISPAEREKLRFFEETLEEFLREKEKLRIAELIERLFRRTGYDLYVLRLRQGERRFANLRKLVEKAREMESKEPFHLGDFVRAIKAMETREVRESQAQVEAEEGEVVKLMSIHVSKGLEFPVVILPDLGGRENPKKGSFLLSEEGLGLCLQDEEDAKTETLTYRRNKQRIDRLGSEESKRKLYVAMTRARDRLILAGPRLPDRRAGKSSGPGKTSFHEMSTWAEWVDRILSEGTWDIRRLEEAPPEAFPFEKRKALADRKPIRSRLETMTPIRLRETPLLVDRILENMILPERADFERIDLPVSAFLLYARDPEAYFSVYELGAPVPGSMEKVEMKEEEPALEEEVTRAEFGTRVHLILEHALLGRKGVAGLRPLVDRFNQDLRLETREEIFSLTRRFLESPEAREILRSTAFYPELPFVLRLPHGLVHGKLDLVYKNSKGEWVILDYKTSFVEESSFRERGEEYRAQLELYALAICEITGQTVREARIQFLRPGLVYQVSFQAGDFERLLAKFTKMQKDLLVYRKARMLQNA